MRCFYDADEQIDLWVNYLAEELLDIYGEQAARPLPQTRPPGLLHALELGYDRVGTEPQYAVLQVRTGRRPDVEVLPHTRHGKSPGSPVPAWTMRSMETTFRSARHGYGVVASEIFNTLMASLELTHAIELRSESLRPTCPCRTRRFVLDGHADIRRIPVGPDTFGVVHHRKDVGLGQYGRGMYMTGAYAGAYD